MEQVGFGRQVKSAHDRAYEHYLRTGERFTTVQWLERERKFNPYHDPEDGRFTFAPGGPGGRLPSRETPPRLTSASISSQMPTQGTRTSVTRRPAASEIESPRRSTPMTADRLRAVMPAAATQADVHTDPINRAMAHYRIESPEQQAVFLAQISVESENLQKLSEGLNYSARRIIQVWPRRFPTLASAQPYANNPIALANRVYANRNGNGDEASGDGFRYRGRGILQITGRSNYRALGFEKDPDTVLQPYESAFAAAGFWKMNRLNDRTRTELNREQFNEIVGQVNGGHLAADRRWQAYQRALALLRPKSPSK